MLKGLRTAVSETPYSAVLQHLRVKVKHGKSEDKQVYHARVLETLRGPELKEISYTMSTEPGETPVVPKEPVIVTLCKDAEGYYWPGVGSIFPKTDETHAAALSVSKQAPSDQSNFDNCE